MGTAAHPAPAATPPAAPLAADPLLVTNAAAFRSALDEARAVGRTVGLVPTMGALHAGHASLVTRAAAECDLVAVTVFVNPLQFGPGEDLDSYPRTLDADIDLAGAHGAGVVFAPDLTEMFPGPVATRVSVSGVSEVLDGASRPGHFDGVATVVARLFALAGPCRAYFGEKDFQQVAVVTRMVADLGFPVEVVPCPTVRAADGLALSSRNAYLSAREREAAPVLHRALDEGRRLVEESGVTDADAIGAAMAAVVAGEPLAHLDYAVAVDPVTLTGPDHLDGPTRLLIAARIGPARLIDNMGAVA